MSEGPGEHTELTPRSFASFGLMMLGLGLLSVGFSVIDTAMVAPFGLVQVAAVGLGEAVVSLLLAFFAGFIDVFTARLARAEGAGQSDRVFPELLRAYLIVVGLMELLAVVVAAAVWVVLPLVVSDHALAHAARQYAAVRLLGVALVAALAGVREALKIVGARTGSLAVYAVGLGMNAALNAVFLHVMSGTLAGAATVAVAIATLVAQLLMTIIGGILLRCHLAVREFEPPSAAMVREQARTMVVRGAGVGVRHLNDYAGSTIPFVMAGTLGVTWVAASTVASTIWTLFCRVPQACFGAAFVFYGYVSESGGAVAREVRRRIAIYSAIPMAVAVVVFLALSPALIWILTAGNLDTWTGMIMVAAFFIVVVPYFFEGLNGELLSVLEDGGFMSWTSTLTTWLGNIGFAAFGIFVLHSAFWGFAFAVIPTIVLGSAFTWRLNHLTNRPMSLSQA